MISSTALNQSKLLNYYKEIIMVISDHSSCRSVRIVKFHTKSLKN